MNDEENIKYHNSKYPYSNFGRNKLRNGFMGWLFRYNDFEAEDYEFNFNQHLTNLKRKLKGLPPEWKIKYRKRVQ